MTKRRSRARLPFFGLSRARAARVAYAACLSVAGLIAVATQAGSIPDAEEILRRAEAIRNPQLDYTVDLEILISDPQAMVPERRSTYTVIAQGKDRSLVWTREPERLYGTILIIDKGHYWMMLPRASRSLELSPRQRLGGSVANGDLARANLSRHYDVRLAGEEVLDGELCWRLELSAADALAAYPRIQVWVSRRDDRPVRMDYHGQTGARLRRARFLDYRESLLGRRCHRIEVREKEGSEATTTIVFRHLRPLVIPRVELDKDLLTLARDGALSLREGGGEAALAEDLVAILGGRERETGNR